MVTFDLAHGNRILALLPSGYLESLLPDLELEDLPVRACLEPRGHEPTHAHFILRGVGSMVSLDDAGNLIEVATVGFEGVVGLSLFLGGENPALESFMQVPGSALRMAAGTFRTHSNHPEFSRVLKLYTQALLNQVAQSSACIRMHTVEHRCARWLLQTHDRVQEDVFELTQEFLAMMLAVRRATVSEIASQLQEKKLIQYYRGVVTVLDRKGLERVACGCYRAVTDEYNRLLGKPVIARHAKKLAGVATVD